MNSLSILLVGDLSGAGNALRAGFHRLGHNCTHIAYQNGWRKNPLSINLTSPRRGLLGSFFNYKNSLRFFDLSGFDKIIFLDYTIAPLRFGINRRIYRHFCAQNADVYLWLLGCDAAFHAWSALNMDRMCSMCMQYDLETSQCSRIQLEEIEEEILNMVDFVVPGSYEYDMAHTFIENRLPVVPIPVDVSSVPFAPIAESLPIRVLHALNREGMKGTHIVRKAFNQLEQSSLHDQIPVTLELGPRLPYHEHITRLFSSSIVIDQLFNKSLGVNSLITLASGRVLIAGDSKLGCQSAGIPECGFMFSSSPQPTSLVSSITNAVNNVYYRKYDSSAARQWVQEYHDASVIAKRFLDIFKST